MADIKKTARAVILINNELVLIKRVKYNNGNVIKEYYVTPGGHLDEKETFEEAVIREVKEELGINVKIKSELLSMYNEDLKQEEKFYECEYVEGKIGTGIGEEWSNPNVEKYGSYEIVYVKPEELDNINLLPIEVKEKVIEKYKN